MEDSSKVANQPPDSRISHADALSYWNSIPPTVNGMLGGFHQISSTDLRGSANFLAKLRAGDSSTTPLGLLKRGVDCGAGIGRVTAGFLSRVCHVVDVVEPIEKFAKEVKGMEMGGSGKLGKVYVMGLEEWIPQEKYDLIWNQWCLGHLTDAQLVSYLKRCKQAVPGEGFVVVKENMSTDVEGKDIFDEMDNSVTRSDEKFRQLFAESDYEIVRTELQKGFPKGLYPVRIYALRPKVSKGG
ncbi:Alpha N-terminal protein methyltransferase 1 [Ptychographa xylographoides]|nr:Alpha N-terminal protein methyltransferase 1 [Ptychographa xylographoides]